MKKILSILLVVLMLVGMLPINAMHVHAAESKYVKVTENLTDWSGEYLIVYEAGNLIFDGSLTTLDTQKKAKSVTISSSTISVDSKHSFTIAKSGSSYTIKSASGYYIGNTSNNNKLLSSTSTAYTNTIKLNTDKTVQITGSGSSVLRFNKTASEMRFRYYKSSSYSSQQAICLYKLEEATSCQHTNTTTTTENATCTEAGSTIVTCKDCGAEVSKTTIAATGHTYGDGVVTPPTCTDAGYTTKTCTVCGNEQKSDEVAASGHKYDTNGVCSVCNNTLPVVSFVVPSQVAGIDNHVADENGDVELPAAGDYTGSGAKHDYTFFGWMEQSLSKTTDKPTVYKAGETIKVTKNTTLYAVYTYSVAGAGSSTKYVLTDLANIGDSDTVVITVTNTSGTTYALTSANGSSSAPTAVKVTVSENALTGTIADELKWNIVGDDTFVIYPAGDTSKWLYSNSSNNGIRVGTITTNTFRVDQTYGYLQNTNYSRYVGVYNNADWRSYTTNPTSNNIKGQTLGFYVETTEASSQDYYTSTLESEDTTCQHTNTTTTTVPATCTEAGSTTVTCDACGDTVSQTEIPATGHTEVVDEAKAPTCSQTGLTEGSHCSVCNTVITAPQTIPATGEHTYVDGTCSSCGAAEPVVGANRYYIAAIRVKSNAPTGNVYYMTNTLTTTSTKRYAAEDSGLTGIPERITEPETDKVFVLVDNGDGTYKIYAEGLTEDAKYLGHSSGNSGAFVTEANAKNVTLTYDENGAVMIEYGTRNLTLNNTSGNNYFAWYESVQAKVYLIPVGEACKHPNAENHEAQAATCENVGYTAGVYCTDCEKYIEGHEEIPATGHSWNEGEVTTAATCLTAGEKTVTCQNDNSHTKTEVIPALGHDWNDGEIITAATCEKEGEKTVTCQRDNSHIETVKIPALGHDWDKGVVITEATCETAGEKLLTCQNDNSHTKTEVIPASGHSYDANGVCENCGKKISRFVLVDDYTTILAGGEYIIAARVGDSFYAISTSSTTVEPASQSVTVEGSGADMYVTYAEGLPIWNVAYDPYGVNAFTLYNPVRDLYLRAKDQAFVAATEEPWAWSFKDASNKGFESDGTYGISISGTGTKVDGATAFVVVSDTIVDRAIGLAQGNSEYKTQSLRGQTINVELFFFKLEEAQEESYTVTFVEDGTVTMTQQVSADENVLKMPKPVNDTMPEGYTKFVGWVNLPYMETLIAPPSIYSAEDGEGINNVAPIKGNTTFYALYSREDPNAEGETMSYHLVTDENQLVVGEKYIIVAVDKEGNYRAMSKDQLSDDRGTSLVYPDAEGVITFLPADNVGVFMLTQGQKAGTFGFLDLNLDKFLYCSSTSSNNSLKSQSAMNEAASFSISIDDADYKSLIVGNVTSARNTMMFNGDYNLISSYDTSKFTNGIIPYLYVGVPNSTFATYYTTGLCHHEWEITEVKADCDNPGYTMQTCTICGKVEMTEFAAHGHDVGSSTVVTAPTCTTTGKAISTCKNCGKEFEEVLPALGHTSVVDAAVAAGCETTGLTEGSHCSVCSIVLVPQQVVAALGHTEVIDPAVPADCVNTGLTEGKHCSVCDKVLVEQEEVAALGHSYDEGVTTKPTITEDGYITYTCTVCGHSYQEVIPAIGPLKFTTATLTLRQNLSINFRAKGELFAEGAYSQPYAVFKFGYEELTVTDYVIVDGKYEFTCYNISPSQMTEVVSATLYGYFDGELIEGETTTYSVAQYCTSMLNKPEQAQLHTLIVDMLYYGDEASKFANYRTEELATSILTEEQKALHTTAVPALDTVLNGKYAVVDAPKVSWKAVTLVLDDSVEIRYRLEAESIEGLTVQVTAGGKSWTLNTFKPVPGTEGQYYVQFNQLSACMMRETVLITVYEGDTAVSNTLSYSIESYACSRQNDPKVGNLVLEMMRYGDSAYNYFMKEAE